MLVRCYDSKFQKSKSSYKDCTVCDEWLNFQNFAKWHDENYYEIDNERMDLDKDILIRNNKIYSPRACCFVPVRINCLLVKNNKNRGEYPIGVYYDTHNKVIVSSCHIGNNHSKFLGTFKTVEEAFQVYKNFKESFIKEVAEKYKNKIPDKLYQALIKYEVKFDD